MAFLKWPKHDPDAILDYGLDWAPWLDGDTIDTSEWFIEAVENPDVGEDVTPITEVTKSKTDTTTTIWLQGGTPGITYEVTNRIVTTGDRTQDQTAKTTCKER